MPSVKPPAPYNTEEPDDQKVFIFGEEYIPKSSIPDASIIESLRDENASIITQNLALETENRRLTGLLNDSFSTIEELTGGLNEQAERNQQDIDKIYALLNGSPPPDEELGTVTLYPHTGQSIQDAIADETVQRIYLTKGTYHTQVSLQDRENPLEILAYPGDEGLVTVSGLFKAGWEWSQLGDGSYAAKWPGVKSLWHHHDPRSAHNSNLQYPVLCTIGDEPLMWSQDENVDGKFWIDSPADTEGLIVVKLKEGQSIEDFRFSPYPWLLKAHEGISGITIKDINFKGCSNTGFTGAVNLPGSNWHVENVTVSLANTIGIELGQGGVSSNMRTQLKDSMLINVAAEDCGQMGWWGSAKDTTLSYCGHTGSNWKNFDFNWHASHKFENMHGCTIEFWLAAKNNGPGLWFDGVYLEDGGGNTNNDIIKPSISQCVRTGIELELGTSGNRITDPYIDGILQKDSPNPDSTWSQSVAIMVKGFSNDNTVTGGTIRNADKGILIDNTDSRGPSERNKFSGIDMENIQDAEFMIYGDTYENTFEAA